MRFSKSAVLLSCVAIMILIPLMSWADIVFYSPDGKILGTENSSLSGEKATQPLKKASMRERLEKDAQDALDSGFKEGDTVKIEDGIIFRLFKDTHSGKYTLRMFRRVMIKTNPSPSDLDKGNTPGIPDKEATAASDDKPSLDKSLPEKKEDTREFPRIPIEDKEKKTHPPQKGKSGKKIFAVDPSIQTGKQPI